jgi:DNA topoisomerase-1
MALFETPGTASIKREHLIFRHAGLPECSRHKFYCSVVMKQQNHPSEIRIPKKKISSLAHDNVKSAEAVNLVYVHDQEQGINRVRKGTGFIYVTGADQITDTEVLARIKKLVLPPAWEQVWICLFPNGHLQATGIDTNGRKQYRYHPLWNVLRSESKFFHLYDFGKALPLIRHQISTDLALHGLPQQKVLAAIVSLMEYTGIRVGNNAYEKLYGSFGLTTLKDRHITIDGSEIKFSFRGKKGVYQNITVKSKKLARIVRQCRDIPGKELFQYYDEEHNRKVIDSGMVNGYIQSICGKNFTAKDFRTWVGTSCAIEVFRDMGCCDSEQETKRRITEALDIVAKRLGNTRTVCRKYYVHPVVIDLYSSRTIEKYIVRASANNETSVLNAEEQILMDMLENKNSAVIVTALPQ